MHLGYIYISICAVMLVGVKGETKYFREKVEFSQKSKGHIFAKTQVKLHENTTHASQNSLVAIGLYASKYSCLHSRP